MKRGMKAAWVLLAVGALITSGCSSSGSDSSASKGTKTKSTAAARATTSTSIASTTTKSVDYGKQYLSLVAPSNCALDRLNAALKQAGEHQTDWPWIQRNLLPAAAEYSKSLVTFYEALSKANWPASAKSDIHKMIADAAKEAQYFQTLSSVQSLDDLNALPQPSLDSSSAAAVRADLGLPSNIGSSKGSCPG